MTKSRKYLFVLFVLFSFSFSPISRSQDVKNELKDDPQTAEQSPSTIIRETDKQISKQEIKADDLIHFGDLIDVDVVGSTEYDWRGELTPEGFLDGIEFTKESIYGLCRTPTSLGVEIAKNYGTFLNSPRVVVTILDRTNRPVTTLFGAVKLPQRLKIRRTIRLNELIVLAGGLTEKASGEIQILRQFDASCKAKLEKDRSSKPMINETVDAKTNSSQSEQSKFITIKISELLRGEEAANPEILYGDTITVLAAQPIYVIGGVRNPTKISIREKLTVIRAIAIAGGFANSANRRKISLFRRENGQTRIINVNFEDIENQIADDIPLQAYDIVDVAENGRDEKKFPPVVRGENSEDKQSSELPLRIID